MRAVEIPVGHGLVTLVDEHDAETVLALGRWHATPPRTNGLPPVFVTPERLDRVRTLARSGLSAAQIGDEIGIRPATVSKWMQRYDIPSRRSRHTTTSYDDGGAP